MGVSCLKRHCGVEGVALPLRNGGSAPLLPGHFRQFGKGFAGWRETCIHGLAIPFLGLGLVGLEPPHFHVLVEQRVIGLGDAKRRLRQP